MREMRFGRVETPIGRLYVGTTERGLALVTRQRDERKVVEEIASRFGANAVKNEKAVREVEGELEAYFAGKATRFSSPLDLSVGTPFQQRVWRTLLKIPYGETRSYKWVARDAGTEGYRAVGMANHRNPVMIVVPCHRVIAEDGSLGGYACGLGVKRKLLSLETSVATRSRETQAVVAPRA